MPAGVGKGLVVVESIFCSLTQSLIPRVTRKDREEIKLKFIDTSSKFGHGRFQSPKERLQFMVCACAHTYSVSLFFVVCRGNSRRT